MAQNPTNGWIQTIEGLDKPYKIYSLKKAEQQGLGAISRLPFSLKILLESMMRNFDGKAVLMEHIRLLADWAECRTGHEEIPFKPGRVVLQDFTGVPAVVDLAAMREAVHQSGGDPAIINPQIPVDLIIDHSLIVDAYGNEDSMKENMALEYERNEERYRFLRWAQSSFQNFRVVPPGNGIVHQVNLEYLATGVIQQHVQDDLYVFPDSVIGTDSHTTMINGLGILGWGVGGIEAESAMLGQPLYFVVPEVIGIKLTGKLQEGVTATDLTLTITQWLRKIGVVGKFIEFFGEGLQHISAADRATIANMAPEYGATLSYFPMDQETLRYLSLTGRTPQQLALIERYYREQGIFRTESTEDPIFTQSLELDLSIIKPSIAGPKRPQDRLELDEVTAQVSEVLIRSIAEGGYGLAEEQLRNKVEVHYEDGATERLETGSIVIAAITSCTNTSNPSVMIGAGLLAQKALAKGLKVPRFVKTSLTPGSRVVTAYLRKAGLLDSLESLGFYVDGYGCASCGGNTGPLSESVAETIKNHQLTVASILSGNRNFEGRIHPLVKMNFLASPPLVIAYALAGTMNIDLTADPLGHTKEGQPVLLKDIWPTAEEIQKMIDSTIHPDIYAQTFSQMFQGDERWNRLDSIDNKLYAWDPASTYIQRPSYIKKNDETSAHAGTIRMRALGLFGDSITTDHISPVGNIAVHSPAGKYLHEQGVASKDFNQYGARRGNYHVMIRGTFANIRLRNRIADGKEGGYTRFMPTGEMMTIYDAAMRYQDNGVPLIVIAGKEYGTGSSRDWAAKGTALLGVKAVLAESFERIHRSNLVGMGVLPLQFLDGEGAGSLGLNGTETYHLHLPAHLEPRQRVDLEVVRADGDQMRIEVVLRLDSQVEIDYYQHSGILPFVLRKLTS